MAILTGKTGLETGTWVGKIVGGLAMRANEQAMWPGVSKGSVA
jgi:hypothetical protein